MAATFVAVSRTINLFDGKAGDDVVHQFFALEQSLRIEAGNFVGPMTVTNK